MLWNLRKQIGIDFSRSQPITFTSHNTRHAFFNHFCPVTDSAYAFLVSLRAWLLLLADYGIHLVRRSSSFSIGYPVIRVESSKPEISKSTRRAPSDTWRTNSAVKDT